MSNYKIGRGLWGGAEISRIGFGCWAIGGDSYGRMDDEASLQALQYAVSRGVNFFDTADIYGKGHSEELIGQALAGSRDKCFIATKAGWDFDHGLIRQNFDRSYLLFALESSLRRLKMDYLDLFQLHNPPKELALDHELMQQLEEWRRSGKIRSYGVSVHGVEEALFWMKHTSIGTLQIAFNLLDLRPLDQVFGLAQARGCVIIVREPLACGMLTEKYGKEVSFPKNDHRRRWPREKILGDLEKIRKIRSVVSDLRIPLAQMALEFVLSFPEISVVIPGMKMVNQVQDNLKAAYETHLNPEMIQRIVNLHRTDTVFAGGYYRN